MLILIGGSHISAINAGFISHGSLYMLFYEMGDGHRERLNFGHVRRQMFEDVLQLGMVTNVHMHELGDGASSKASVSENFNSFIEKRTISPCSFTISSFK